MKSNFVAILPTNVKKNTRTAKFFIRFLSVCVLFGGQKKMPGDNPLASLFSFFHFLMLPAPLLYTINFKTASQLSTLNFENHP